GLSHLEDVGAPVLADPDGAHGHPGYSIHRPGATRAGRGGESVGRRRRRAHSEAHEDRARRELGPREGVGILMMRAILLALLLLGGPRPASADAINALVGDVSWLAAHGRAPTAADELREVERVSTHLAWVE